MMAFAEKAKALRALDRDPPAWRAHVAVRVLRNYTLENLEPLLRYAAAQDGLAAKVSFSDFDTFEQEILDPASATNTGTAEAILLSLWLDGLLTPEEFGAWAPEKVFDRLSGLIGALKQRTAARIFVTTFFPPFAAVDAVPTKQGRGGLGDGVERLNAKLMALAADDPRVEAIDLPGWARTIGPNEALDARFWYMYRAPLKNELLEILAREIAASLVALKCGPKKALALDCDETLWGGIVGEDGLEGIALGPEAYPGNAFLDFQRQLLELKRRGVTLTLCSKNNPADALAVFERHPHCLLKKSDFAAWQINWEDKATNLRRLASQLALGLDSFVFIDDSAAECDLVRKTAPEVTVLQRPERPCDLPQLLRSFTGFRGLGGSAEDRRRGDLYAAETQRLAVRAQHESLETYLASLALVAKIGRATPGDIVRIAQLTQKTNQFNLTTRRYLEGEVERLLQSREHCVLALRASDRFGDYGLTGVAIARQENRAATIEAFLLSCRILGRQLEFALLSALVSEVAALFPGTETVEGVYRPTEKNGQVADFYRRAGFTAVTECTFLYRYGETTLATPAHITLTT